MDRGKQPGNGIINESHNLWDVNEQARAEEALRRYAEEQKVLRTVASATASSLDTEQVLAITLDTVLPLLSATAGWISLPGPTLDDPPRLIAHRNLPPAFVAAEESSPLRDCPACAPLLTDADPALSPVLCAECPRLPSQVVAEARLHSHVSIPLSAGQKVLGLLNVAWDKPAPYSKEDRTLLLTIGQQVGLALHNAQLYQQARQIDRLRFLNDLDRALAATLDLDEMIEITLRRLATAVGVPMGAAIAFPLQADAGPARIFTLRQGWIEMGVYLSAQQYHRDFMERLQRAEGILPLSYDELCRLTGAADAERLREWGDYGLIVPILREGTVTVVLALGGRQEPFTEEDQALIQAAAAHAAQFIHSGWQHRALAAAEARYRDLYHSVPVGLYRATPDGRFLAVNRSLVQMLGYPDEETLLATPLTDLYLDSQDHQRWQDQVALGARSGFEVQVRCYDGRTLWLYGTGRAVRDQEGQVLYYDGSMTDITARKQAELAIQEAEQRYRTVADFTYDWEYWEAPDGRWLYASPSCERITGYPPERFIENPHLLDELIVAQDRDIWNLHRHDVQNRQPQRVLFRIRRKNGEIRWIEHRCQPVVDRSGAFLGYRASNRDATDRVQTESQRDAMLAALQESEERLRTLINASPDIICFKDGQGRWLLANEADLRLFQLEGVDYRGKTDAELAEFSPFYRDAFLTCEDTDEIAWQKGTLFRGDKAIPQPDGAVKIYDIFKIPLFHPDGRRRGMIVLGRDITEHRRAEAELRRSEANLVEAQRIAQLGSWEWEIASGQQWWTEQTYHIFGVSPETFEVTYNNFLHIVHPDDRERVIRTIDQMLRENRPYDITHRILRPDGEERVIHERAEVLLDDQGRPQRVIGTAQDITEQVRMEERLAAAARENERLYQEAREQAARLATLNAISVAITSSLDINVIIPQLLEQACQALDAASGSILIRDPNTEELIFARATANENNILSGRRLPPGAGIAGWVMQHRQSVLSNDVRRDPRFYDGLDEVTNLHVQSLLCVPFEHPQGISGVIEIVNKRHGAFSDEDLRLLEAIAPIAAVALENAQLYASLQVRISELEMLYNLGLLLSSTMDSEMVIETALTQFQRIFQATGISLLRRDAESDRLRFAQTLAGHTHIQIPVHLEPGEGIAGWVLSHGQSVVLADVQADPRWSDRVDQALGRRTRSLMAAPLRVSGKISGVVEVVHEQAGIYTADDLRTLDTVAFALAVALENARLYEEQKELLRQREIAQAQMIHSEKMAALGRLSASIAHEINNPLQSVQVCLNLAEEELGDQQRRDKMNLYLGLASGEIERVAGIVKRMRDFYRPAREEKRPTDIQETLETVLALTHKKLQHGNITVVREWADLPTVQANADHLKQIFLNLVLNAIDAMPQGGTLYLRTGQGWLPPGEQDGTPAVRIEFSDTGEGVPPETLPHLFEPFFTTKEHGSGLGLFVSAEIIDAHGGNLSVESRQGEGTTFTILLPVDSD